MGWQLALGVLIAWSGVAFGQSKTQARLEFEQAVVKSGEVALAGIHLTFAPGWYTYWQNPGGVAYPAKIVWTLPAGVEAGAIQWVVPAKKIDDDLVSYYYDREVLLMAPLKVGAGVGVGAHKITAKISWLECEKACVPASVVLSGELVVGTEAKSGPQASLFEKYRGRLPKPAGWPVDVTWTSNGDDSERVLRITFEPGDVSGEWDYFPNKHEDVEFAGQTSGEVSGAKVVLQKRVKKGEEAWPEAWSGLLVQAAAKGAKPDRGFEFTSAKSGGGEVAAPAPSPPSPAKSETPPGGGVARVEGGAKGAGGVPTSLWAVLGAAFLGGMILNVMPCVLPVIALKILGFVRQSSESPGRVRQLGLLYTLGVLSSFLVLAILVIGVKSVGNAASWGMQFQNPIFLVCMLILVTLVSMNLFGVFEVILASGANDVASRYASKEGGSGAFFNGVLATILATPCTAPFLAGALGFAFAQPAQIILLVFLTAGAGLAAPYLLLSWQPGWLRLLPKPGPWMERFKIATGFPMVATGVWLLALAPRLFGGDGVLWLGLLMVVVALIAWIYGQFIQRGVGSPWMSWGALAVLVGFGFGFILEHELDWRHVDPTRLSGSGGNSPAAAHTKKGGIEWRDWSPEAVGALVKSGRPVLVDFTADWCILCQNNKRRALEVKEVREKLKEVNAVALLGDYTLKNPAITEELARYERAGVPLVLVFSKKADVPPRVLGEYLTKEEVIAALEWAVAP